MSQMRTHSLEGRKREERVGELQNVARHKRGLTRWRGGRGRSGWGASKRGTSQKRNKSQEGRKRGEGVGELRNVARHKPGLTRWRGGRGRSGLVSFETWHVINEDSLPGGEEEGGAGW